jgi:hypothetical protein
LVPWFVVVMLLFRINFAGIDMPRKKLPPRLYLRKYEAPDKPNRWVILHGAREFGTGCMENEEARAQLVLERYLDPKGQRQRERQTRMRRPGVVYFIEAIGVEMIKVGFTRDLPKRLADLKTALPIDLRVLTTMPGDRETEARIQAALAEHRVRGEWFRAHGVLSFLGMTHGSSDSGHIHVGAK